MGTRADFEGAYDLVAAGAKPVVDSVFPLAEARAAHERLEAGEQFGKILSSLAARLPGRATETWNKHRRAGLCDLRTTACKEGVTGNQGFPC